MKKYQQYPEDKLFCRQGMTLVEIMVALVIVSIIAGVVWNVSLIQSGSVNESGSILQASGSVKSALELIKRDLTKAGYGVLDLDEQTNQKNMAFFIQDGGANNPDRLYLFWGDYIDQQELMHDPFGQLGYANIDPPITTNNVVTVDRRNLDSELSDDTYGVTNDPNELAAGAGIWLTVITNSSNPGFKVARISGIAGNTLTLDQAVAGTKLSPAVFYCVDSDGTDPVCATGGDTQVLRRSTRTSGGRMPICEKIVDLQVVYKSGANYYNWGTIDPCPNGFTCNAAGMNPFQPGAVDLVRISLITQTGVSGSLTPVVRVANGKTWGGAADTDGNGNFRKYSAYTISIRPRNNLQL